jgi:pimeloyl-ACP methyl ester carboxylesterase
MPSVLQERKHHIEEKYTLLEAGTRNAWLDIDGLRIRYFSAGEDGPPMIFLHGGGIDSALISWGAAIGLLSREHRVFAPDLPGYGESSTPDIAYTMDYYVHFLERFMDTLNLERASLVGLSLGGGIALNFTLRSQSRVEKLVLAAPYYGFKGTSDKLGYLYIHMAFLQEFALWITGLNHGMLRWALKGGVHNQRNLSQELINEVYQQVHAPKSGQAFASFQRSEVRWQGPRTDTTNHLHEITVPTLILNGQNDTLVPVAFAQKAHNLISTSQIYVLRNCGHWIARDQPDEFNEIVTAFLQP